MSSSTSIVISDEIRQKWSELKNDQTLIYLIFKIESGGKLALDAEGKAPDNETAAGKRQRITTPDDWEEFRQKLSSATDANGRKGARYALYDLRFENANNKPIFISYVPDDAGIKTKMVYASSKESLKSQMGDEGFEEIQANDDDDIEYESLKKTLGRRTIV